MGKSSHDHERRIAALEERVRVLDDAVMMLIEGVTGAGPLPSAAAMQMMLDGVVKHYRDVGGGNATTAPTTNPPYAE